MPDLRLILLLIGLLLIAGIYIWELFLNRKRKRQQTFTPYGDDPYKTDVKITREIAPPGMPGASISNRENNLSGIPAQHYASSADMPLLNESLPVSSGDNKGTGPGKDTFSLTRDMTGEETPGPGPATADTATNDFVILHVTAPPSLKFTGQQLLDALNEVGMEFGDMNIFHHYGIGDIRSDVPLFSLANMYEPGSFNEEEINKMSINGVSLFFSLPGVLDPLVIFELMLNTANRLAEILGGELLAQDHKLADESDIKSVRDRINEFMAYKP